VRGRGLPRWFEAPAAALGLLLVSPVLALAAAAVLVTSGRPVLFRQERVGLGGKRFRILKLRTMRPARGPQVTVGGDARVTPVGRFLRKAKLDELPQLWNVLSGDMSLVGPRPEVPAYVDPSSEAWTRVLAARPGLTDPVTLRLRNEEELLAAVPGDREEYYRSTLQPWKLRGYVEYQTSRTWMTDLEVLARTAVVALVPGAAQARGAGAPAPWP
jgi:lipopolysaccharide/colanic/teichoic acid biosynthesis glycosyltransferase